MNLQTLSLGNTESMARRTGQTVDLTGKVESMSRSQLSEVMKIPPVKPPKEIPPTTETDDAAMYDAFSIKDAQRKQQTLEDAQAMLSGLNTGIQFT